MDRELRVIEYSSLEDLCEIREKLRCHKKNYANIYGIPRENYANLYGKSLALPYRGKLDTLRVEFNHESETIKEL